jgi:ElaB/YqjD/DUF883 family membrane-anchored ribosome-binding protein
MSAETGSHSSDTLVDNLRAVVRDAEELLRATSSQTGDKLHEIRARAEESLRVAKARIGDIQEDALKQARHATSATEDYVRENPWQALGIAAGIGIIVGLLVSRR